MVLHQSPDINKVLAETGSNGKIHSAAQQALQYRNAATVT
jgi:hypothetical protein